MFRKAFVRRVQTQGPPAFIGKRSANDEKMDNDRTDFKAAEVAIILISNRDIYIMPLSRCFIRKRIETISVLLVSASISIERNTG